MLKNDTLKCQKLAEIWQNFSIFDSFCNLSLAFGSENTQQSEPFK